MAHLIRFITQFRTHTFTFLETDFHWQIFVSDFEFRIELVWIVFDFGFFFFFWHSRVEFEGKNKHRKEHGLLKKFHIN